MRNDELTEKREILLKAAHECKGVKMWAMWIKKSNELRNSKFSHIQNKQKKKFFDKFSINKYGFARYNLLYKLLKG